MRKSNNYAKYEQLTPEQLGLIKVAYFPALEGEVWPLEFNAYLVEYAQALDNLALFKEQHWLQIDIDLDYKKVTVGLESDCVGTVAYNNICNHFKNLGTITSTDIHYFDGLNSIVLKPLKFADSAAVWQLLKNLLGLKHIDTYLQKSITRMHLCAEIRRSTIQLEDSLQADLNTFKLITGIGD